MVNTGRYFIPRPRMLTIRTLLQLGIDQAVDDHSKLRVQVVNGASWFTLVLVVVFFCVGLALALPTGYLAFNAVAGSLAAVPLLLNTRGHIVASRVLFLCQSYVLIAGLVVLFGRELHFQYFLVGGIGMSLLFFDRRFPWKRWLLSVWALPEWLLLEVYSIESQAIVAIPSQYVEGLRIINDLSMMSTVLFMVWVFTRTADGHIDRIAQKADELAAVNADLSRFSMVVSHDLKAPLRGIVALIRFIEEDHPELHADVQTQLGRIKTRTEHMHQMIVGILEYSHAVEGAGEIESFELRPLLEGIVDNMTGGSQVRFELPDTQVALRGRKTQLSQVLANLMTNAVKYGDAEGGVVEVHHGEVGGVHTFRVKDNGPGIPEEAQANLFDLFETAGQSQHRSDSTGVGLAIVQGLVERNGGEVGLHSRPGEGAEFYFTWRDAA